VVEKWPHKIMGGCCSQFLSWESISIADLHQ
jgi:hypothetical protein